MRIFNCAVLIIIMSFNLSCDFSQNKKLVNDDSLSIDFEIKKGKKIKPNEWKYDVVENDVIYRPTNWKFLKQDKAYYFCYLNNTDKNTFFTIINYKLTQVNSEKYLKLGYSQLMTDTTDKLKTYSLRRLVFTDKQTYFGEYFTDLYGKEYVSYSMIFEKYGRLYDILLRIRKSDEKTYKSIFSTILFNIQINGILLFDENDKLENVQSVDMETL